MNFWMKNDTIYTMFFEFIYKLYQIEVNKQNDIEFDLNKIQQDCYFVYQLVIQDESISNCRMIYNTIDKTIECFISNVLLNDIQIELKTNDSHLPMVLYHYWTSFKDILNLFSELFLKVYETYTDNLGLLSLHELCVQHFYKIVYMDYKMHIYTMLYNEITKTKEVDYSLVDIMLELIHQLEYNKNHDFNLFMKDKLCMDNQCFMERNKNQDTNMTILNLEHRYHQQSNICKYIYQKIDNHYDYKENLNQQYLNSNINSLLDVENIHSNLEKNNIDILNIISHFMIQIDKLKRLSTIYLNYLNHKMIELDHRFIVEKKHSYLFIKEIMTLIQKIKHIHLLYYNKDIQTLLKKNLLTSNYIKQEGLNISQLLNIYLHHTIQFNHTSIDTQWFQTYRLFVDVIDNKDEYIDYNKLYLIDRLMTYMYEQENKKERLDLEKNIINQYEYIDTENLLKLISEIEFKENNMYILNYHNWNPTDKLILDHTMIQQLPNNCKLLLSNIDTQYKEKYEDRYIHYNLINSNIEYSLCNKTIQVVSCLLDFIIVSFIVYEHEINNTYISNKLNIDIDIIDIHVDNLVQFNIISKHHSYLYLNQTIQTDKLNIQTPKQIKKDTHELDTHYIHHNRFYIIQSSIVKMMKYHKQLDYSKLLEDIQNQITLFKATQEDIDTCITKLIKNDYLNREKNNIIYID